GLPKFPTDSDKFMCPAAESNHRHGDFESLEARLTSESSFWERPPRPVKTRQTRYAEAQRSTVTFAGARNRRHSPSRPKLTSTLDLSTRRALRHMRPTQKSLRAVDWRAANDPGSRAAQAS